MKNKTYKCEKCSHNFSFAWNLKQHMKHSRYCGTSEEEFKCTNCGKKFTLSATLKQHFARCIAVDPYRFVCTNCNRKFTFKSSLRKHLRGRCPNIDYDSAAKNKNGFDFELTGNLELEEVHIDEIEFKKTDSPTELDTCDIVNSVNTPLSSYEDGEVNVIYDLQELTDAKVEESNESKFMYQGDNSIDS